MCNGNCEYYGNCPVGLNEIEFEFENVKFSCLSLQKLYDKFVEVKDKRNEEKKSRQEGNSIFSPYTYFG